MPGHEKKKEDPQQDFHNRTDMGDFSLDILRRQIREARLNGVPEQQITDDIRALTEFNFENADSVLAFMDRQDALARTNDRRFGKFPGAVLDFLGTLGNEAFGGAPQRLLEKLAPETGERVRQITDDLELLDPKAVKAIKTGAPLAIPALGFSTIQRATVAKTGSVLLGDAVASGATGGLVGAITGAGRAEPGEAVSEFLEKGLIAGLVSSVAGAGLALVGRTLVKNVSRGSTSDRVIKALKSGSGVRKGIREITEANTNGVNRIKDNLFRQLDNDFAVIDDVVITDIIKGLSKNPDTASIVRSTSPTLFRGKRPPGHIDLQKIRAKLRAEQRFSDLDELTNAMNDVSPRFQEANTKFALASQNQEAFDLGRSLSASNKKAAGDIELLLNTKPENLSEMRVMFGGNPEAQQMFKNGMVIDAIEKMGQNIDEDTSTLNGFMRPGSTARATMRQMFPGAQDFASEAEQLAGNKAFEKFANVLERELGTIETNKAFRQLGGSIARLIPLAAALAGGAAITGRRSAGDR